MAQIKIYGTLTNVTDNAIVDSKQVIGGYMSLTQSEIDNLSSTLKVEGMLIYNLTDSKFYQLKNNVFEEVKFGGGSGGDITVDSALSLTSTNPVQNKIITEALNNKQDNISFGFGLSKTDDGVVYVNLPDGTTGGY